MENIIKISEKDVEFSIVLNKKPFFKGNYTSFLEVWEKIDDNEEEIFLDLIDEIPIKHSLEGKYIMICYKKINELFKLCNKHGFEVVYNKRKNELIIEKVFKAEDNLSLKEVCNKLDFYSNELFKDFKDYIAMYVNTNEVGIWFSIKLWDLIPKYILF